MSWKSGVRLARRIWERLEPIIPEEKRQEVARAIVEEFEDGGCDNIFEAEGLYTASGLVRDNR